MPNALNLRKLPGNGRKAERYSANTPQAESDDMVKRDSMSFVFSGQGTGEQIPPEEFIARSGSITAPGFGWYLEFEYYCA